MSSLEDEAIKQGNLLRDKGDFDGAIAAYVSVKDSPLSAIPESMVPSATGIAVSGFGWLSDESEARCGLDFPLIALCN